ncbi:MAG TPA: amino acid racemase [Thermoanaerobaculia bacterium]|jgi:aspartate racemase|nr:amino acid racemase [Thermoanaerobaculia bacterium]
MKLLGIVGGIGPESTIDYYKKLVDSWKRRNPDGSYPRVIINSIDATPLVNSFTRGDLAFAAEELTAAVRRLANAGADIALIAANTPHLVFDEVARAATIPLISIVEATREAAQSQRLQRPALFGTRFTMTAAFYPDTFRRAGMTIVIPNAEERDFIHDKYMNELFVGMFRDETRSRLEAIVAEMKERDGIDGLILAGTELPLILKNATYAGVPVLDTTQIHVESAVTRMLEKEN